MASPAGPVALGLFRVRQAEAIHGDQREFRIDRRYRGEVSHALDASECEDVRQVRRVTSRSRSADSYVAR